MKTQPTFLRRGLPSWAAALLALCMTAGVTFGQSASTTPSSAPTEPSAVGNEPTSNAASSTRATSDHSMASTSRSGDESSLKRSDRRFINKAAEDNHKEIAISQLASQRANSPEVRSYAQQIATEHQQMTQELVQLAQSKGVMLENAAAVTAGAISSRTHQSMDTTRSASGSGMNTSTNAGVATNQGAPRATGSSSTASTPASTGMPTSESTATSTPNAVAETSSTAGLPSEVTSDRHYRTLSKKSGEEFDKSYVDMMVDQHEDDVKLFERAAKEAEDPEIRAFASRHLSSLQAHLEHAQNLMKTTAAAE